MKIITGPELSYEKKIPKIFTGSLIHFSPSGLSLQLTNLLSHIALVFLMFSFSPEISLKDAMISNPLSIDAKSAQKRLVSSAN